MEDIDSPPNAAPETEPAWKDDRRHVDRPLESKGTWLHKAFRGSRENDLGDGWNKLCATVNGDHVPKYDVNVASLLLCLSSASYLTDPLSTDYHEWLTRGVEDLEAPEDPRGYDGPYADYYIVKDAIVLVFKGTNNRQEVYDDLKVFQHKDGDPCKDGKCKQICYRHTGTAVGCGEHCVKGCDRHGEYLRGNTHMGFYNLLFKTTHHLHTQEECKNRRHLTEGPGCAFKTIMEAVLIRSIYGMGGEPMNLWITGHSLGAALASLCMARLQTIVEKDDPIVRGLSDKEKELFEGRTVLDVMTTQFLKSMFTDEMSYACRQCRYCSARASGDDDDGERQRDCGLTCRRCKILKMREARGFGGCCLEGWQEDQPKEKKEIIQVLSGCTKCSEQTETQLRDTRCENCYTSCKQCGQCEPCKKEKCERYLNWNFSDRGMVVLRDCYTFASPKVGNGTFAQQFERNRTEWARQSPNRPVKAVESQYWRVVVDDDPVPKKPPASFGYEHVGELCPTPTPPTRFENLPWYQRFYEMAKSPLEWLAGAHFASTYYESLSLLRAREVKKAKTQ